ncbi:hypothetical protein AMK21_07105 [Streptomyces sp. CB00316]|nr:hypothetical protein AMK21_07105 [Streptomyces sp. CB00316]
MTRSRHSGGTRTGGSGRGWRGCRTGRLPGPVCSATTSGPSPAIPGCSSGRGALCPGQGLPRGPFALCQECPPNRSRRSSSVASPCPEGWRSGRRARKAQRITQLG